MQTTTHVGELQSGESGAITGISLSYFVESNLEEDRCPRQPSLHSHVKGDIRCYTYPAFLGISCGMVWYYEEMAIYLKYSKRSLLK